MLIRTGGIIRGNQRSDYYNHGGRVFRRQKGRMGHNFSYQQQGGNQGGKEENTTLVPGRYGTTLNATCYNFRKTGHLVYNCSEAGCTGICSLKVVHSFS